MAQVEQVIIKEITSEQLINLSQIVGDYLSLPYFMEGESIPYYSTCLLNENLITQEELDLAEKSDISYLIFRGE